MRFLIRTPNWLGDSILCLAALRELRRFHPESSITLLTRASLAPLYEGSGVADNIETIGEEELARVRGPRLKVSALLPTARRLERQKFECAVLFQNAFEAAVLPAAARIPQRLGYATDGRRLLLTRSAKPRTRRASLFRSWAVRSAYKAGFNNLSFASWPTRAQRHHQVYYYLDLLYQTELSPVNYLSEAAFKPDVRLAATPRGRASAEELLDRSGLRKTDRLIVVHPGSAYGPAKRWPSQNFAAVADRLIDECGAQVAVLGWNEEIRIAREIEQAMKHRPILLSGPADLARTMGLFAKCCLLITSDSGPMHLAAGLKTPQVALFGSTDDRTTGPLSSSARVLRHSVECSPCHLRKCPIDMRCWSRIGTDEVFQATVELLSQKFNAPAGD